MRSGHIPGSASLPYTDLLNADGTLSREIMPDLLHLSPKGCEIWAEAIEPKVAELLGENLGRAGADVPDVQRRQQAPQRAFR